MRVPYVDEVVFRAADNVLTIPTEGGLDLATSIQITFVLAGQLMVFQVVQPHTGVVRRDQQLRGRRRRPRRGGVEVREGEEEVGRRKVRGDKEETKERQGEGRGEEEERRQRRGIVR